MGALPVFFALWVLLTVLHQFDLPGLRRVNFYGFVPTVKFFAPIPMTTDTRIYYSYSMQPDKAVSDREWIELLPLRKSALPALWNPEQRINKSLHNIARQILHLSAKAPRIEYTVPYLRILNMAQDRARRHGDGYVQFLITRHRGIENDGRWIVFTSLEHRLADV